MSNLMSLFISCFRQRDLVVTEPALGLHYSYYVIAAGTVYLLLLLANIL